MDYEMHGGEAEASHSAARVLSCAMMGNVS